LTVPSPDDRSSRGFFSVNAHLFFKLGDKAAFREKMRKPRRSLRGDAQRRRARRPRDVGTMSVRYVRATSPGVPFRFRAVPRVRVVRFQRDFKSLAARRAVPSSV
jgi:hypothetical protein